MILRRDIRVRLCVNRPLPPLTRVIAASRPLHCRPNPTGNISFRASEAGENRTNEKKQQVFATLFGCCLCQIAPAAQNAKIVNHLVEVIPRAGLLLVVPVFSPPEFRSLTPYRHIKRAFVFVSTHTEVEGRGKKQRFLDGARKRKSHVANCGCGDLWRVQLNVANLRSICHVGVAREHSAPFHTVDL